VSSDLPCPQWTEGEIMPQLDGTGDLLEVASGYRIAAPGLSGAVHARDRGATGADPRPDRVTTAFDRAAESAGLIEVMDIDLDVRQAAPPAGFDPRTVTGEEALVLEAEDPGGDVGLVVAAVDEAGAVTWNFPETATREIEPPTTRGEGGTKRFVIRRTTPPRAEEGADRGLFPPLGGKLLKVFVYPVADAILGPVGQHFASVWEQFHRPYRVRAFGPEDYRHPAGGELTRPEWQHLTTGRALLFLHGTFVSSHTEFHLLPVSTMRELHQRYNGRVFAFDHFTLSHTPEQNAEALAARIPDGIHVDVDIVSHSRGGLLARVLAGELGSAVPGVDVKRSVFVATPNQGTALLDPDNVVSLINRLTTILNIAPPGPPDVIIDILEGILTVVKIVGHAILDSLPGLASMSPNGRFIRRINAGPKPAADYFAIAADFEPTGALLALVTGGALNSLADQIFGDAANDLVVPTLGVSQGSPDPAFPITGDRAFAFARDAGVLHSHYFEDRATSGRLLTWLTG
jgi:hypothetical protein